MYTELVLACQLKTDVPQQVIEVLNFMLTNPSYTNQIELPSHPLFATEKWDIMFVSSDAGSFPGKNTFSLEYDELFWKSYFFSVRCAVKNYTQEIQKFLQWFAPYCEIRRQTNEFVGYLRYEQDLLPTLIYFRGGIAYLTNLNSGQTETVDDYLTGRYNRILEFNENMIKLAQSEETDLRRDGIASLWNIKDERVIPLLLNALKDKDSGVRIEASAVLASKEDSRIIDPLFKALNDDNNEVRFNAVAGLVHNSDKRAYEPLIEYLASTDQIIRHKTVTLLEMLQDKRAAPILIELVDNPQEDLKIRCKAAQALGVIGDKAALPVLERFEKVEVAQDQLAEKSRCVGLALSHLRIRMERDSQRT